jgi:hypothetical protein
MRLLDTSTIQLHEFFGSNISPYSILSHRWEDGEISFKEVTKNRNLEKPGWTKVRKACGLAKDRGQQWIWIDTCCIDKTSSSELTETINSMYAWYAKSEVCYAYLSDVAAKHSPELEHEFRVSKWFTRGWTLQELIAPKDVVFLDQTWVEFGTKSSLQEEVSSITGILKNILSSPARRLRSWNQDYELEISEVSAAMRMAWASRRICTREEDVAYCLLGIFSINMPLLYGEGGRNAFRRLQLEILNSSDDESILAWYSDGYLSLDERSILERDQYGEICLTNASALAKLEKLHQEFGDIGYGFELLAPSPAYFHRSGNFDSTISQQRFRRLQYSATNKGLQFSTEAQYLEDRNLIDVDADAEFSTWKQVYEIPLNCIDRDSGTYFCLHVSRLDEWENPNDKYRSDGSQQLSRIHTVLCDDSPEAIIFSKPSITQPLVDGKGWEGNRKLQAIYIIF